MSVANHSSGDETPHEPAQCATEDSHSDRAERIRHGIESSAIYLLLFIHYPDLWAFALFGFVCLLPSIEGLYERVRGGF